MSQCSKKTATSRVTATEKKSQKEKHIQRKNNNQPIEHPGPKLNTTLCRKLEKFEPLVFFLCHLANLVLLDIYRVSYFFSSFIAPCRRCQESNWKQREEKKRKHFVGVRVYAYRVS